MDETAGAIKKRMWEGGCGRGGPMTTGARKVIEKCVPAPSLRLLSLTRAAQVGGHRSHLRGPGDG